MPRPEAQAQPNVEPDAMAGEQPLKLKEKVIAAAGASVVSALVVNPLDVVKTRMQAHSLAPASSPVSSVHNCLFSRQPGQSRWAFSAADHPASCSFVSRLQGSLGEPTFQSQSPSAWARHHPAVRMGMSSCACLHMSDMAATGAAEAASMGRSSAILGRLRSLIGGHTPSFSSVGMLRDILQKEGVSVLWRGADTAILASIPMIGVYMPLYDYLLPQATAWGTGAAAPLLAGSTARTIAVFLVAPLELIRTRQQGLSVNNSNSHGCQTTSSSAAGSSVPVGVTHGRSAAPAALHGGRGAASGGGGGGALQAIRSTLALLQQPSNEAGSSTGSTSSSSGTSRTSTLRALPRLWTGFAATLARDVPFSALYWGLVEPARAHMLALSMQQNLQQQRSMGSASPMAGVEFTHAGKSTVGAGAPTPQQVLSANLLAGSTAGAIAAVVTTPFDVVKTRLQVADRLHARSLRDVMAEVVKAEGLRGLFRGTIPRVARTAPACAIVVGSYELLKAVL